MSSRLRLAPLLLALAGCAPSAEDVEKQFETFVNGANQCTAASECAVVTPGCPLGCFIAVRADRKAEVEAKARDLIAQYERAGARCEYECIEVGPLTCTGGRCGFGPVP